MRRQHSAGARRIAAGIMGLMMLIVVLFSAFFIVAEAHHDCSGEDCPICACMQLWEKLLRGSGCGAADRPSVPVPLLCVLSAALPASPILRDTLISGKVRLND